jgi:hypothetical protein
MKISVIAVFACLLVGCESSRRSASLSPDQARAAAIRLANDKASTLYHCQPFQDGRPASFTQGHWTWRDARGYGLGDIQATVELAADGSTNSVDIKFFDNQNPM